MKLKIMTYDALDYVKSNISSCLQHYKDADNPEEWLPAAIGKQAFVEVEELEFEDFELFVDEVNPSSTDIPNIKLLFSKLSSLNESFASDERLWAGLTHTLFYEYTLKRWKGKTNEKDILNHFFFDLGKPRSYMVNSVSRLWWYGKKTYDKKRKNPYAVLDYIGNDINGCGFPLFGSNWSNSERTLSLFFDAIFDYTAETNETVRRELFNDTLRYTNCLCGVYVLDACDDGFIKGRIKAFLYERSAERKAELEYNRNNNVKATGIAKLDNIICAINTLGGCGTLKQICDAYEGVTEKKNSDAVKEYIKRSLNFYCPDTNGYVKTNPPLFYRIEVNGEKCWKVANEYLFKANKPKQKALMESQIETLTDDERLVFNVVASLSGKRFSLGDALSFMSQIATVRPDISDLEVFISRGLKALRLKGLLEMVDVDKQILKKSYEIKIL